MLPKPLPADRYEKLLEDSPFAVATTPAPVEKPEEPWAANLFLGSAARITTNGQEEDWAVIKQKGDPSADFSLTPSETGPDGIKLIRIEWSEDPALRKAVLKKGDKEATVQRNEADFAQAAPPTTPLRAGAPGLLNNNLLNGGAGPRKLPAPQNGQGIPRPSIAPAPVNKTNVAAPGNQPTNNRQRIRVIEPGPRAK